MSDKEPSLLTDEQIADEVRRLLGPLAAACKIRTEFSATFARTVICVFDTLHDMHIGVSITDDDRHLELCDFSDRLLKPCVTALHERIRTSSDERN